MVSPQRGVSRSYPGKRLTCSRLSGATASINGIYQYYSQLSVRQVSNLAPLSEVDDRAST